ncbi:C-X-C motif chemokine 10-like [Cololabis saira]|uniref:C-X-C motif chemokine 10-like n=1 Tax=Cololabis saira TaxID=129043 RepID=UPI002AD37C03|nr:C-X-C motif chemokine 10-like [Cololabis saira]
MSSFVWICVLLAAVVCFSEAQVNEAGQTCLCQNARNGIRSKSSIKDIQIYPATVFCSRVEIVVSQNDGLRYCLNPELRAVKRIVTSILGKQKTSKPTSLTFTSTSASTPRI